MNLELRDRLVSDGYALLAAPVRSVAFTNDKPADGLLNDLAGHPHAFVLACLVDRQVRAEWAWRVPWVIGERNGSFEIDDLAQLTEGEWLTLLRRPEPAHRMPETMATVLHRAVARIKDHYDGDASRIWAATPPSALVVRRFLEFHGAGPKIATMAANILVREFHVPLGDHRYIDISADVQTQRVMARLGVETGILGRRCDLRRTGTPPRLPRCFRSGALGHRATTVSATHPPLRRMPTVRPLPLVQHVSLCVGIRRAYGSSAVA